MSGVFGLRYFIFEKHAFYGLLKVISIQKRMSSLNVFLVQNLLNTYQRVQYKICSFGKILGLKMRTKQILICICKSEILNIETSTLFYPQNKRYNLCVLESETVLNAFALKS